MADNTSEILRQIQIAMGTNPQPGKPRSGSQNNTNGIDRKLVSNLNVVDKYRNERSGTIADASDGEKAVLWALQTKAKGAAGLAYERRGDISKQEYNRLVQNKAIADGTWKPSDGFYTTDSFDPTGMSANNYLSDPEKYMPDPRAPGEDGPYGFTTPNGMVRIPGTDRSDWQWARDNGYDYTEGGTVNGKRVSGPKGGYNVGFTTDESKKGDHQKFLEAQTKANGIIKFDLADQAQGKNAMIQRELDNADEILWQAGLSEDKQQEMMRSFGFTSTASSAGSVGAKEVLALTGSQNNAQNEKIKDQLPVSNATAQIATTEKERIRQIQIAMGTNPKPGQPRNSSTSTNGIDQKLVRNVTNSGSISRLDNASEGEKAVYWALQTKAKGVDTSFGSKYHTPSAMDKISMQNMAMANGTWKSSDGYYFTSPNGLGFDPTGKSANNTITNPENYMPDPRAPGETGPYGIPTKDGLVRIPEKNTSDWRWAKANGYDYHEGGGMNSPLTPGPKGAYSTGWSTDPTKKSDSQLTKEATWAANGVRFVDNDLANQAQNMSSMAQRDLDNADEILWQAGITEDKQKELMQSLGFNDMYADKKKTNSKPQADVSIISSGLAANSASSTTVQQEKDEGHKLANTDTVQKNENKNSIVAPAAVRTETNDFSARASISPEVMSARKSAIESRLQKIAEQRQPYGGTAGATSVVKDSGALVPPPIAGGTSNNGLPIHR